MINIEKFVLKNEVENVELVKIPLKALKWFGYMIFEYQSVKRLQCFRGVVFTVSFILFNITQVIQNFFSSIFRMNLIFHFKHLLHDCHHCDCSLTKTTVCGFISRFQQCENNSGKCSNNASFHNHFIPYGEFLLESYTICEYDTSHDR